MSRKKITSALKRLVLTEKKKVPHLGVRALAKLLADKHKIIISKSAISKILASSGMREKKGRKQSRLGYERKSFSHCGLLLLRCLDCWLGIFNYLSRELWPYFPKISKALLKQLIILASFSALINEDPEKSTKRKGFLRLSGLNHFPVRKLDYFKNQLTRHKPRVELKPFKDKALIPVSTIKVLFNNGYCGYFDARMSTIWSGPCRLKQFFLPLKAAFRLIERMLVDKTIILGYTKSFGHLSSLSFNFMEAMDKGIKNIEFLDPQGKVLRNRKVNTVKITFFIGYYPENLSQGVIPVGKVKRFKSFFWEELGEFLCSSSLARFSQQNEKQSLILNNVLIKQKTSALPCWGLITSNISSKKVKMASFLRKYLYLWPDPEKSFIADMKIIENSFLTSSKNKGYLSGILPKRLVFRNLLDFAPVGQILSVIFKETIWGWEPKNKQGNFTVGKDYIRINLKKIPREVKRRFNNGGFYLEGRRALIR